MRDAFEEMHNKNVIGEGEMEKCGNENGERIVNVIRAGEDWGNSLMRRGGEGKRLRDGAFKVSSSFDVSTSGSDATPARQALGSSQATFTSTLANVQSSIAGSSSAYYKDLKEQAESLDSACGDGGYPCGLK